MRVLLNEHNDEQHLMVGYFSWMGMATELISNQFRGSLGYFTSIFDATHLCISPQDCLSIEDASELVELR